MQGRLHILVVGLLAVAAALFVVMRVMAGLHFVSVIELAAILLPILLILALANRGIWIGIMMGLCAIIYYIPFPIFDRLNLRVFWGAIVLLLSLSQHAISKDSIRGAFGHPGAKLLLLVMVAILLRLLYERPGSARFGSTGGGGEAYTMVLAFLMFPVFVRLAGGEWDVKKNLLLAFGIAAVAYGAFLIRFITGESAARTVLYQQQAWLLAPAALAMAMQYRSRHKASRLAVLYEWSIVIAMMAAALFTQFRSRLWFAVGALLAVSYVFGRTQRTLRWLAVLAAIGLPLAVAFLPSLPLSAQRSLSTVLPSEYTRDLPRMLGSEGVISSEVGWNIGFRQILTQMAFTDIKKNPLFGRGWTFSYGEILAAVWGTQYDALALAGGYHNGLLQLTAAMGIPVGLLFACAWLWIPAWFLRLSRRLPMGWPKVFAGTLVGWYVAGSGQLVMNGHAPDFFNLCVMMGLMIGLGTRFEALSLVVAPAAPPLPILLPKPIASEPASEEARPATARNLPDLPRAASSLASRTNVAWGSPRERRSRRVALITREFPPASHANARRPFLYAQALQREGCDVTVFTGPKGSADGLSESAVAKIIRVPDPLQRFYALARGTRMRHWLEQCVSGVCWPDLHRAWARAAVSAMRREGPFDTVVAFVLPASLIVALNRRRPKAERWVFDYQESVSPFLARYPNWSPIKRRLSRRLEAEEALALERASAVVFTSLTNRQAYIDQGLVASDKAVHIPYFFQPSDFTEAPATDQQLSIAYFGTFDGRGHRNPSVFLAALAQFLQEHPEARENTRFVFRGNWRPEHGKWVSKLGLEDVVEIQPPCPHAEYLKQIQWATALLLVVAPEHDLFMPSKLADYLGARRPILAFAPRDGEMWQCLKEAGMSPWLVDHTDVAAGAAAIERLWTDFRSGSLRIAPVPLRKWNYVEQAPRIVRAVLPNPKTQSVRIPV